LFQGLKPGVSAGFSRSVKESLRIMANVNQGESFIGGLGSMSLYKKTQGRLTRQLTILAVVVLTVCACYSLANSWLLFVDPTMRTAIPSVIAIVIAWLTFRAVNYGPFAEFLISVQAEMTKVNWPSWLELKRATIVVVFAMFFLGLVLFVYDIVWYQILSLIGVLKG
jgi:preprotein translocase subunit SecE